MQNNSELENHLLGLIRLGQTVELEEEIKKLPKNFDLNFQKQGTGDCLALAAAERGDVGMVKLLITYGVNMKVRNNINDTTPSFYANHYGNKKMKELIDQANNSASASLN